MDKLESDGMTTVAGPVLSAETAAHTIDLGGKISQHNHTTSGTCDEDGDVENAGNADVDEEGGDEEEDSSDSDTDESSCSSIHSFMLTPTPVNTMVGNSVHIHSEAQTATWNDDSGISSLTKAASFSAATPPAGPPQALKRLPVPSQGGDPDEVDTALFPESSLPVPPPPTLIHHNFEAANCRSALSPTSLGPFLSRSDSVVVFSDASNHGVASTYSSVDHINPLSTSTSTGASSRIHLLGRDRRRSTRGSSFSIGTEQSPRSFAGPGHTLFDWLGLGAHGKDYLTPTTSTGQSEPEGFSATRSMATTSHADVHLTPEELQRERDRKRLEQLGYSEVLGRDYGFWPCFSVAFCNIGFLQGTLLGILGTFKYGGPR